MFWSSASRMGLLSALGSLNSTAMPVRLGRDVRLQELGLQVDVAALRRAVDGIDAEVPAGLLDASLDHREELDLRPADEVDVVFRFLVLSLAGGCPRRHAR